MRIKLRISLIIVELVIIIENKTGMAADIKIIIIIDIIIIIINRTEEEVK